MPFDPATVGTAVKVGSEAVGFFGKVAHFFRKHRYEKPAGDAIGIVIAINATDPESHERVTTDFVSTVRKLSATQLDRPLQVIELPKNQAEKIRDEMSARRALDKCRAHFIVWGTARKRKIDDKEHVVLDLWAYARHNDIVQSLSETFGKEMAELLPRRAHISMANDLIEMELTALTVQLAAHYIVAVAAYLSEELPYALSLFEELQRKAEAHDAVSLPEDVRSHV
ncbi:MAG: hypothetical protein JO314_00625, partial [Acidobacteria bacterium]|nr:hypothetical protein [Acidobacteriota bacterium]